MQNKIGELKNLVYRVENGPLQVMLLTWIEKNIMEFSVSHHITNDDKVRTFFNIEELKEHHKRSLAGQIGLSMLDKVAVKEVRETPYSEETTYRIFAIKG